MYAEEAVGVEDLTAAVVDRLPAILTEVRALLERHDPGYAAFLAGDFDEVLVGARHLVGRLLGLPEADPARATMERVLFEEIGRAHQGRGQPVTELLAAYHCGARIAWRQVAAAAIEVGVAPDRLAALAADFFAAVEELCAATLHGYLAEPPALLDVRSRSREELLALLLAGDAGSGDLQSAADRAEWPLPRTAAVVVIDPPTVVGERTLGHLQDRCLWAVQHSRLVGIVADPDGPGHRGRLRADLAGAGAAVGNTVTLGGLPRSLARAELAARLIGAGALRADPVFVDEHLDNLIVQRDPDLLAELRERCLAPLARLPAAARQRLTDTIRCWLTHMGHPTAMAACLHVHPQTVRYRLRQLRELFGPDWDDPATRATLILALAWGHPEPPAARRDGTPPPARMDAEPSLPALRSSPPARGQRGPRGAVRDT